MRPAPREKHLASSTLAHKNSPEKLTVKKYVRKRKKTGLSNMHRMHHLKIVKHEEFIISHCIIPYSVIQLYYYYYSIIPADTRPTDSVVTAIAKVRLYELWC